MIIKRITKYLALTLTSLFAITLILSLHFRLQNFPAAAKTKSIVGTDGIMPITAVSISDLIALGALPQVNFTPDKYLTPQNDIGGNIVWLKKDSIDKSANRGTYEFVILNLSRPTMSLTKNPKRFRPIFFPTIIGTLQCTYQLIFPPAPYI